MNQRLLAVGVGDVMRPGPAARTVGVVAHVHQGAGTDRSGTVDDLCAVGMAFHDLGADGGEALGRSAGPVRPFVTVPTVLNAVTHERLAGLEPQQAVTVIHQFVHPVLEWVAVAALMDGAEHGGLGLVKDQGVLHVEGVLCLLEPLGEVVVMVRIDHHSLVGEP